MQLVPNTTLKLLPKNKAWFTANTELLTNEGWVSISEITKKDLLVVTLNEKGRISPREILSFSTMQFNGEIQYFEYVDIYMEFRYAFPLQKSTFLPTFESSKENIYGRKKYKGTLFNISIPNNTVFVRHPRFSHSGKSILAQTAIVLEQKDLLDEDFSHDEEQLEKAERPELYGDTDLVITNIMAVPTESPEKRKKTKSTEHTKPKRYKTLSFPNYYLCRVSW